MRLVRVVSAAFLFVATIANGQDSSTSGDGKSQTPVLQVGALPQHLDSVRYGLHVGNGALSGPAAAVLSEAIAHSRYILIGEDHLTREIPQFTIGICNLTATQAPLTGMMMEASPEAADFMMRSVNSPDRWQQMVSQTKAYPWSIAVLDSRQENDMVTACAHASHNPNFRLWGLDYNFEGSAGWLIDLMLAAHPGPRAKAALVHLKTIEQQDAAEAKAKASGLPLFLMSEKSRSEIDDAQPAIDHDGGVAVQKIFAHLITSYRIYREVLKDGTASDAMRAKLLKENFRDAVNELPPSEKSGKIIVKFGDWHLYRGVNPIHSLNLGDYVAETAEVEGAGSLHICVLGSGGTVSTFAKYGQPTRTEEDSMTKDPMYRWLEPFKAAALPGEWTVYDLRGLSYKIGRPVDVDVERVLEGYDFLVLAPQLTAAEMAD